MKRKLPDFKNVSLRIVCCDLDQAPDEPPLRCCCSQLLGLWLSPVHVHSETFGEAALIPAVASLSLRGLFGSQSLRRMQHMCCGTLVYDSAFCPYGIGKAFFGGLLYNSVQESTWKDTVVSSPAGCIRNLGPLFRGPPSFSPCSA